MTPARLPANRLINSVILGAIALLLAACAGSTSALDQLATTTPRGSAFTQALFKNYAYLANSFAGMSDDSGFSLFDSTGDIGTLAEAYATKALIAASGTEPDPEPSVDAQSANARDRLLRALSEGKDRFPYDAARAQADYDCWMLNATVESQLPAAAQCRASFSGSIDKFERDIHRPVFTPPPPSAPPPVSNYTVYFEFVSWTLTGEQLTVLQDAINTARAGGQSRITIVGHTDTSGSPGYNQGLSVKRANVVKETLVTMGARPEAIEVSGVGETDLAVLTGDGVREPKNRRAVVTLIP
ncbi:MAG: OmpA family protein [Alphaproteobacteria bacterium]|nr:OmpA family protein [Alphaproteobacteria bacterium]